MKGGLTVSHACAMEFTEMDFEVARIRNKFCNEYQNAVRSPFVSRVAILLLSSIASPHRGDADRD